MQLADGIGNRKPFAGFLLGASPHAQRSVNKLLACFIHAFLSFLLHVSSYSALIPSLIAPFDVQENGLHHSVLRAIICWFMDQSDNGEWFALLTYKIGQQITFYRKKRISWSYNDLERAL